MKVIEHYDKAKDPLISFEVIPPKRGGSTSRVFETMDALDLGVEWVVNQSRELLEYGVSGLHFVMKGTPEPAPGIMDQLDVVPVADTK